MRRGNVHVDNLAFSQAVVDSARQELDCDELFRIEFLVLGKQLKEKAVGLEWSKRTTGPKNKLLSIAGQRVGTLTPNLSDLSLPTLHGSTKFSRRLV